MKLVHYSNKKICKLQPKEYPQSELTFQSKPNGLWFSVEGKDGWKEWSISEKYRLDSLRFSYEIILNINANILYLNTPEDIYSFTNKYPLKLRGFDMDTDTHQLNWNWSAFTPGLSAALCLRL